MALFASFDLGINQKLLNYEIEANRPITNFKNEVTTLTLPKV